MGPKYGQRQYEMKSYDELNAIKWQMAEAKKNERADALKELKRLSADFVFTAAILKGSLAEDIKVKRRNSTLSPKLQ